MISPLLILGIVFAAVLLSTVMMSRKGEKRSGKMSASVGSEKMPPKPTGAPFTAPTWSSRGAWAIPFAVRYAVSYVNEAREEGLVSDWSPYYRSSQFSNPILSRFPVVSASASPEMSQGVVGINLYRQFEGHTPILLDTLTYPYLQRYTDRSGDDF